MNLREAQECIKRSGFAWTAVWFDIDNRFLTIGARWKATEYLMTFTKDGTKLLDITKC